MRILEVDFQLNLLQAILWEYNDALKLQTLLEQKQNWYNSKYSEFWESWVRDVFDLRTANDFGLSLWAIILNLPLLASESPTPSPDIWGVGEFRKNFNNGNFYPYVTDISLTTEERRLLLRLRYFKLVTRNTIPEINEFLAYLWPGETEKVYVLDGLDMTMTYVFTFAVTPRLLYILQQYDALPRPAGVQLNYVTTISDTWGFGPFRKNFNRGNFNG